MAWPDVHHVPRRDARLLDGSAEDFGVVWTLARDPVVLPGVVCVIDDFNSRVVVCCVVYTVCGNGMLH